MIVLQHGLLAFLVPLLLVTAGVLVAADPAVAAETDVPSLRLDHASTSNHLYLLQDPADDQPQDADAPGSLSDVPLTPTERNALSSVLGSAPLSEFFFGGLSARDRNPRLAGVPDMFGDFSLSGIQMSTGAFPFTVADVPFAGGSRNYKISEHNKALPEDRLIFAYNHFHNAFDATTFAFDSVTTELSVDRYTFGFEKTFRDARSSIDVRVPVTSGVNFVDPIFTISTGEVGDLLVSYKHLIYDDNCMALSCGLGLSLPTGSNTLGTAPPDGVTFEVENKSYHLLPYIGYMAHRSELLFCHGFAQIDFPLSANAVSATDGIATDDGSLADLTLVYLDAGIGLWLYRNDGSLWLRRIAAVGEVHATTAINGPHVLALPAITGIPVFRTDPFSIINLTTGFHLDVLENTSVRIGAVVPMEPKSSASSRSSFSDNRLFDAEINFSVIGSY